MSFFKNITEIQEFVPVSLTFEFVDIQPFLKQVERDYIIPVLGKELYNDLYTKYQDNTTLSEEEEQLLSAIRTAEAPLAYMLWIPWGQVKIDGSGIRIVTTDSLKTAFQWQIQDLQGSAMRSGFSGIESLYEFLEENKEYFTLWVDSDAYSESKELFINTAKELTEASDIPCTRRTFMMVKPIMRKLQYTVIKNTLGTDLYNTLKEEIISGDIDEEFEETIFLIRQALGNLAMASAITKLAVVFDEYGFNVVAMSTTEKGKNPAPDSALSKLENKLKEDGESFLNQLQDLVNKDNEDYDDTIDNDPNSGIGIF